MDFIQRYIFPGSCIASVTAMLESITRSSDLRLFDLTDIGPHYATTLRKWRENVFNYESVIRAQGYSDAFLRMWEFYLCYCEGGFMERAISDVHSLDVQSLLVKPHNRRPTLVQVNSDGASHPRQNDETDTRHYYKYQPCHAALFRGAVTQVTQGAGTGAAAGQAIALPGQPQLCEQ